MAKFFKTLKTVTDAFGVVGDAVEITHLGAEVVKGHLKKKVASLKAEEQKLLSGEGEPEEEAPKK